MSRPLKRTVPPVGSGEAIETAEQRGLAGAGRTDQSESAAPLDLERDVVEDGRDGLATAGRMGQGEMVGLEDGVPRRLVHVGAPPLRTG